MHVPRVRGGAFRALALIGLALLLPRSARADDEANEEPESQVSEEACALGPGRVGTLRTIAEPPACGRYCTTTTSFSVEDKGGAPLLGLTNTDFSGPSLSEEEGFEPLINIRCERGGVVIALEDGGAPELRFRFDPKAHRLELVHTPLLQRALLATPLTGVDAEQRARVRALARAALAGAPASDPNTGTQGGIGGIDQTFVDGLTLATARDAIEAGAWERAQKIIDDVSGAWSSDPAATFHPPRALRQRAALLRNELAEQRKNSQPVHVAAPKRLGTVKKPQALPIDPGLAPTLFWRRGELCVVQEDASGTMRCYAPEAQHWGRALPSEQPASSARDLKLVELNSWGMEACVGRTSLSLVVPKEVPESSVNPCEQGPGTELDDVLAVVDGNGLLRAGFQLDRGGKQAEALTVAAANAAFARSAGGLLAGNGRSRFLRDGRLALAADDGEHRWDVLGAMTQSEAWAAPPLVSPDQRWVVGQAKQGESITLWLFQLQSTPP